MASNLQQKRALASPTTPPGSGNNAREKNYSFNCNSSFPPCSSSTSATYPWGTWEDLLLASAVLRHGVDNWTSVSCELQARAFLIPPSLFSAEACKVRFWILDGRFSSCNGATIRDGKISWFEEVRKLRVAQLKRELEHYDGSIGLLEQKLKRLKAGNAGVEALECRDDHKQDNVIPIIQQETVSCSQDLSAYDQMPGDSRMGIASKSLPVTELTRIPSSISLTAIAAGDVQETKSASGLKELVTVKHVDSNLSCSGIFDEPLLHNGQCVSTFDHNLLARHDLKSTTEVGQRRDNSMVCTFIESEKTLVGSQDAETENNDVTLSLKVDNPVTETKDNHKPLAEEKQVRGSPNQEICSLGLVLDDTQGLYGSTDLDSVVCNNTACEDGVSENGLELSCGHSELNRFAVDVGTTEPVKFVKVVPSSATKLSDNITEGSCAVEDALSSASAMDLLRIAYADGTPVSTPEETENHPVNPVRSGNPENEECLCTPLSGLPTCEPDLCCVKKLDVPSKQNFSTAQKMVENKFLGSQMPLSERFRGSEEAFGVQRGFQCSSEWEHSADRRGYEVIGTREVLQASSNLSDTSNLCLESTVKETNTEQWQEQVGGYPTDTNRACSSVFYDTRKPLHDVDGDSHLTNIHRAGKTSKQTGADSLDCVGSLARDSSNIAKFRFHLGNDEVEREGQLRGTMLSHVIPLPKTELDLEIPGKLGVGMFVQGLHPDASPCDLKEGSQSHNYGVHSGNELKGGSSSPSIRSSSGTSALGEALDHGCHPACSRFETSNPLSCQSDGTKPDTKLSLKLTHREVERGSYAATRNSSVRKVTSAMQAGSKTITKKPALGGSEHMLTAVCSRIKRSSSHKVKHRADVDAFEEDGLLVDLIKLKDSDLTTLRKRKHLGRGGTNVNECNNNGLSQDTFGPISAHKQPKLSRHEQEANKTSSSRIQNKSSSEQKSLECSSGGTSDRAAFSSNVSLSNSHRKVVSKEPSVGVFSTRRSRFKVRRLESQVEELEKTKLEIDVSVQKGEIGGFKAADGEVRKLECPNVMPGIISTGRIGADNGLLPDILILLECLRKISGHRFAPLFKIQSDMQSDARYRNLVKRHMDLNTVRSNLEEGAYFDNLEFFRDMILIFTNALVFYPRYSQEYSAARVLRENIVREMDRILREEDLLGSSTSTQEANCNELKALSVSNISCSENSDGKEQASGKSSCGLAIDDGAAESAGEATSVASFAPQDLGLGKSACINEPDSEKKDEVDCAFRRLYTKTKMARSKAHPVELDRSGRDKCLRQSADILSKFSMEKDSVPFSQGLRKPFQALPSTLMDFVSSKGSSDKLIGSKESYEGQGLMLQERQESSKRPYSERSSRRAQQSRSREIQSYCRPHRRSRT